MTPSSVFHYTSAHGLLGSVQQRCLWASEASGLNDYRELDQGWELIEGWLADQPRSQAVTTVRDQLDMPRQKRNEVLVLSASTDPEDAGQWRSYGDAGHGYALELDTSVPLAVVATGEEPKAPPGAKHWIDFSSFVWVSGWSQVIYDPQEIRARLDTALAAVPAREQWAREAADEDEFIERSQAIQVELLSEMTELASLYKTRGFSGEREYRVVATSAYSSKHLHHRAGQFGLVSYVELTGAPRPDTRLIYEANPELRSLPLLSVRLGPGLADEHRATVDRFLRMHKLADIPVTRVNLPLR